jgi:hypothetical protein
MEPTKVMGQSTGARNCEKCGIALADVDYDKAGRLVSRCPNRFIVETIRCRPRTKALIVTDPEVNATVQSDSV